MFFDNESYIAELPPEYIYEACLGIRDFEYTFSQFEFDNRKFIDDILLNFDYVSEGVKSKSLSIQACSGLYNWYLKLAVVVQLGLTGTLSIEDNYRLKSIKKSKTNPLLALQELVELFEYESISEFKYRIEASFDIFLESLEYKIKQKHNISDWYEWAKSQEIIKLKTNKLVKVAFDHKEILRVYSKDFDVLEIERWPLSMFNMLIQSVENDIMDASGEVKTVNIAVNGQIKQIQDIELSPKSALLLKNISNLIDANARYITNAEIEKLIIDLMGSYIK